MRGQGRKRRKRRKGVRRRKGRRKDESNGRKLVRLEKVQDVRMADFEASLTGLTTKRLLG